MTLPRFLALLIIALTTQQAGGVEALAFSGACASSDSVTDEDIRISIGLGHRSATRRIDVCPDPADAARVAAALGIEPGRWSSQTLVRVRLVDDAALVPGWEEPTARGRWRGTPLPDHSLLITRATDWPAASVAPLDQARQLRNRLGSDRALEVRAAICQMCNDQRYDLLEDLVGLSDDQRAIHIPGKIDGDFRQSAIDQTVGEEARRTISAMSRPFDGYVPHSAGITRPQLRSWWHWLRYDPFVKIQTATSLGRHSITDQATSEGACSPSLASLVMPLFGTLAVIELERDATTFVRSDLGGAQAHVHWYADGWTAFRSTAGSICICSQQDPASVSCPAQLVDSSISAMRREDGLHVVGIDAKGVWKHLVLASTRPGQPSYWSTQVLPSRGEPRDGSRAPASFLATAGRRLWIVISSDTDASLIACDGPDCIGMRELEPGGSSPWAGDIAMCARPEGVAIVMHGSLRIVAPDLSFVLPATELDPNAYPSVLGLSPQGWIVAWVSSRQPLRELRLREVDVHGRLAAELTALQAPSIPGIWGVRANACVATVVYEDGGRGAMLEHFSLPSVR